jgi:hypothetical protein
MKSPLYGRKKFLSVFMIILSLLFIIGCADSGDDSNPFDVPYNNTDTDKPCTGCQTCSVSVDPISPWKETATPVPWLTSNPFNSKHDGGWVYSPCEDVLYAMYGEDNDGKTLYRIDYISEISKIATTFKYGRHGAHPVIDDTGTYIYMPPSSQTNQLERYNVCKNKREKLRAAPANGTFSHGAWKNGKLWIVLDDGNLYSYNPVANTWSGSLHYFGGSNSANVASSGPASNLIYVIVASGGNFYSYDVTDGTTNTLPSHPYGFNLWGNGEVTWFGATDGFIYAMGGCGGTPAIYDIAGNTWYAMYDPKPNSNCIGHATYDCKRNRLYVSDGNSNAFYYQFGVE